MLAWAPGPRGQLSLVADPWASHTCLEFRRPEEQLSFSPAPTSKGSPTPVNPAAKLGTCSPFSNPTNAPQVLSGIWTNNFSNANLIRSLYSSCPWMASHCSEESRQFPSTACKALGHSSSLASLPSQDICVVHAILTLCASGSQFSITSIVKLSSAPLSRSVSFGLERVWEFAFHYIPGCCWFQPQFENHWLVLWCSLPFSVCNHILSFVWPWWFRW